jgi:metal-responsive CopG/Arc/MetJ family transcriptional regulator
MSSGYHKVFYQEGVAMPRKVLVALPAALLEQVDDVARTEHRTRSDLIRESLRRYLEVFKRKSKELDGLQIPTT